MPTVIKGSGDSTFGGTIQIHKGSAGSSAFPSGNWAAKVFNQTDSSTEGGLIVANRWAAAASTAFEVGGLYDAGNGYDQFFKVDGSGNVSIGSYASASKLTISKAVAGEAKLLMLNNTYTGGLADAAIEFSDGSSVKASIVANTYGNDYMAFRTGGNVERMRILPSGGITFNGDTASANALDDYEEGTCTIYLSDSNGNNATMGGGNFFKYTKIGDRVTVTGTMNWTSLGSITTSRTRLTGLPFTAYSNVNYRTPTVTGSNNAAFNSNIGDISRVKFGIDGGQPFAWGTLTNSIGQDGGLTSSNINASGTIYGVRFEYQV
jgi:hypothetical protein